LPNVGPYIYDVSISGFTRSSIYIYIYDISSLRVTCSSVCAVFVRVPYGIAPSVVEDVARACIKNTTHLFVFPWS